MLEHIYMDKKWAHLQEAKEDGNAETFKFEDDHVSIVYTFIKRKAGVVNGQVYYDLVTPRGEMGPYIVFKQKEITNDEFLKLYKKEFLYYCHENNIIAEYIRFDSWNNMEKYFSDLYVLSEYGDIFGNQLTYDFFEEEFTSSKRRNVNKAIKEGVTIEYHSNSDAIQQFLKLYHFTQEKYTASSFHQIDESFINRYFNHLKDKVTFAQAIFNNEVISSVLVLIAKDIMHYHLAAHHPLYLNLNANALIIYETAKKAQTMNKKIFDLGSAKKGSSLEKYKKGIAKPYKSTLGTAIRNPIIYNKLIQQAGGPRLNYFPAYRHN